MSNKFQYDHSMLSLSQLHKIGIRSAREIEEVIEGYSFADELYFTELGYRVMRILGFTKGMQALKVAATIDGKQGIIFTLDASIPTINEVIEDFCRFAIYRS